MGGSPILLETRTRLHFKTRKRKLQQLQTLASGCGSIPILRMELLPGIPDDITLTHIVAKLPRRMLSVLPQANWSWKLAIQRREVYDARVRSKSTEAVVVVNHLERRDNYDFFRPSEYNNPTGYVHTLALYSMQDKSCSQLPPFPGGCRGFPWSCQCVPFDGKLYVLGGIETCRKFSGSASKKVYVLDLAGGQGKWRKCASMREARAKFGSYVIDGKIYIFGGDPCFSSVTGSEVYDPKVDAWFRIKSVHQNGHDITKVGDELLVQGGGKVCFPFSEEIENVIKNFDRRDGGLRHHEYFEGVYHPEKNEWRLVKSVGRTYLYDVFLSRGQFHRMDSRGIFVYDMDAKSWSMEHSFSFSAVKSSPYESVFKPFTSLIADDEILGLWPARFGTSLLRGRGLRSSNEPLEWQIEVNYAPSSKCPYDFGFFMHPMQL